MSPAFHQIWRSVQEALRDDIERACRHGTQRRIVPMDGACPRSGRREQGAQRALAAAAPASSATRRRARQKGSQSADLARVR